MQYKLLATTALAAAGLWASTEAASAQAKVAPISVVVGGYHEQTFGYAGNKSGRTYAAPSTSSKINKFSQFSDSEIFFGGRTTLANGITIGFDVQLEANTSTDQIDESYIFVDGAFGRFLIGTENSADNLMHHSLTGPGRAYGPNGSGAQSWIIRPTAVTVIADLFPGQTLGGGTALPATGNDQQRLTYFTPRFWGFQAGASYTPNVNLEDSNGFNDRAVNRHNAVAGSINYVNTIGPVAVNASAGIHYYPKISGAASGSLEDQKILDWAVGGNLTYMGFTVGAGLRRVDTNDRSTEDGYGWGVSAAYATGPFAIGLSYLASRTEGLTTAGTGKDKFGQILLSGAYTMGPGVDLIGSIFHISYKDEGGANANKNSGVGVVTGLRLTF